ncbi:MAG: GNAT family N-acetyltransferase [Oscillospiraceae bacterium]|nr:GNAT family N-acetyltransferase [Oscillospiraceae bacterium]
MEFLKSAPQDKAPFERFWMENFGETAEEILPFFRDTFPRCRVYRAVEDGNLCATLYALPQEMKVAGKTLPMVYIYGVATDKTLRGQGLATRLFAFAEEDLKHEGFGGAVLVPAGEHLFPFYEKLGYSVFCYRKPVELPAGNTEIASISADVYLRQREEYLVATAHNVPPVHVVEYHHLGVWDGGMGAWEETAEGAVYREILGKLPRPESPCKGLAVGNDKPYAVAKAFCQDFPREGYFSFAME